MAVSRKSTTNSPNSSVLEADHPVRQSKSAKIIETAPVIKTAAEKKRNMRQPR
jgi:hypothetical protein